MPPVLTPQRSPRPNNPLQEILAKEGELQKRGVSICAPSTLPPEEELYDKPGTRRGGRGGRCAACACGSLCVRGAEGRGAALGRGATTSKQLPRPAACRPAAGPTPRGAPPGCRDDNSDDDFFERRRLAGGRGGRDRDGGRGRRGGGGSFGGRDRDNDWGRDRRSGDRSDRSSRGGGGSFGGRGWDFDGAPRRGGGGGGGRDFGGGRRDGGSSRSGDGSRGKW